jgi:hypothetical protein
MTAVQFRNPEVRLSEALQTTRAAVSGHQVTLRELLVLVGEQGLLVSCAILAMPFLLPVWPPFMSTALGGPMLLIGHAVTMNRVPWLPDRLLDHALATATVEHVLDRAAKAADRFEHLFRPRILALTAGPSVNAIHGAMLVIVVLALMAPLPLIPLANTLPAIAIILLCLGMAERARCWRARLSTSAISPNRSATLARASLPGHSAAGAVSHRLHGANCMPARHGKALETGDARKLERVMGIEHT